MPITKQVLDQPGVAQSLAWHCKTCHDAHETTHCAYCAQLTQVLTLALSAWLLKEKA